MNKYLDNYRFACLKRFFLHWFVILLWFGLLLWLLWLWFSSLVGDNLSGGGFLYFFLVKQGFECTTFDFRRRFRIYCLTLFHDGFAGACDCSVFFY